MIAIIDYGVGNLFSLGCSLKFIGQDAVVTDDIAKIRDCDKIILPGVGAFEDAAAKLSRSGLAEAVTKQAKSGKPLLGICLGMQLLFDKSLEFGEHTGLGLIPGIVAPIEKRIQPGLKIPHIGWNALDYPSSRRDELFKHLPEGAYVYFVHSYHAENCDSDVIATTEYGAPLTAAVRRDNVCGTQFHPEKSGEAGLSILRAFAEMSC